jgi:Lar family restriction alleviation protein
MSKPDLVACPFCGNKSVEVSVRTEECSSLPAAVECPECGARGPYSRTEENARIFWNRRLGTSASGQSEPSALKKNLEEWERDRAWNPDEARPGQAVYVPEEALARPDPLEKRMEKLEAYAHVHGHWLNAGLERLDALVARVEGLELAVFDKPKDSTDENLHALHVKALVEFLKHHDKLFHDFFKKEPAP